MMRLRAPGLPLLAAGLLAAACGGEAPDQSEMEPAAGSEASEASAMEPTVEILRPAQGDTVQGPSVRVELAARGFTVVPAGDTTANSGHHHLFLDRDVSPAAEPIPAEEGRIVHMGDGSATFTFESVSSGQHRLIAVVGDAVHVPVPGFGRDTVTFTVR